MLMQEQPFGSHLQMQQTGSIGAIHQLVGRLHLMVSLNLGFGFQDLQWYLHSGLRQESLDKVYNMFWFLILLKYK